jgi:hypothetical protein
LNIIMHHPKNTLTNMLDKLKNHPGNIFKSDDIRSI